VDHAEAYRRCLTIRLVEETLKQLKAAGAVQGSLHLCTGQEAIPTAGCAVLRREDRVVCTYRGHGWVIARGVPLADFFAEVMGRDSPLCGGRGGSAYLSAMNHGLIGENSIVGGGLPIAVGSALRSLHMPDGAVTVAVIGDGALNQGAVHEALNFAAVLKLPLVTIVENNGYAELTPTDDMFAVTPLATRSAAYGIPSVIEDGNDVDAMERAIQNATDAARAGAGPQFVEARTHRLSGHYDLDPQSYRPEGELERAQLDEPLARLARTLGAETVERIRQAVDREIAEAVDAAGEVPFPDPEQFRRHLYA
jgi:TPP-dependent pyruvate/acetoin dehydrogenase alpha subunit